MYVLGKFDAALKLPSVRDHYMRACDPTGYTTATALFEGWQHWERIFAAKQFACHLDVWKDELEVLMRSETIQSLYISATTEGSKGIAAAKYIVERGWEKSKPVSDRQQALMDRRAAKMANARQTVANDAARMVDIVKERPGT